jgi:hypothetical protein
MLRGEPIRNALQPARGRRVSGRACVRVRECASAFRGSLSACLPVCVGVRVEVRACVLVC